MNGHGYIDYPVNATMVEAAKARAAAGDTEGGTNQSVLAGRWHGHLGEMCLREIYEIAGIPVKWDGGVNDAPDFTLLRTESTGDVKTFRISRGPFQPNFVVGVLPEALKKETLPTALVFCVYDEARAWMTALGTCSVNFFCRHATLITKGEPLPSGAIARADELLLSATKLQTMATHLERHRLPPKEPES